MSEPPIGILLPSKCPHCGAPALPEDVHVKPSSVGKGGDLEFTYECVACENEYDIGTVRGVEVEEVVKRGVSVGMRVPWEPDQDSSN